MQALAFIRPSFTKCTYTHKRPCNSFVDAARDDDCKKIKEGGEGVGGDSSPFRTYIMLEFGTIGGGPHYSLIPAEKSV